MTMIFLVLPCPITVAVTRAPSTTGEPTLAACPPATSRTRSRVPEVPGSACSRSTFSVRPSSTRYCLPPVSITAYMREPRHVRFGPAYSSISGSAQQPAQPRGQAVTTAALPQRQIVLLIALAHANHFRRPVVQPHHLLPFLADRRALQFLQRRSFGHAQPLEVHPFTRPHAEPPAGLLFYVPDPPLALAEEKPMHIGVHVG